MTELIKNIMRGAGSVLSVYPPEGQKHSFQAGRHMSAQDALHSDWERIGGDFRVASTTLLNDSDQKK